MNDILKNERGSLKDEFCDHWDKCDGFCLDCGKDLTEDQIIEADDEEEIEEISFGD